MGKLDSLKELDLLKEISEGNPLAFRILFDKYHNLIYRYAYKYLKSEIEAEEIVQETFVKIWHQKEYLKEIENFSAYLRVIAINKTLDALRIMANRKRKHFQSLRDWSEISSVNEDIIFNKDSYSYLYDAIEHLPQKQKSIFKMFHLEGFKHKEIAEHFQISPATVKVHLREAMRTLRKVMRNKDSLPLIVFIFLGLVK